ncbi:Six-hairpin glycosidase-like protein [Microdochium bolleyi]|uniref:Six-hairpin glycosidase-like protein n=1 Tax=Microdochium bolleyi TaxID=196109 RepID=A0A136IWN0_9PEZI|nr:Six-hairpin glycosidase-like protein [Microdochium bolleyi]
MGSIACPDIGESQQNSTIQSILQQGAARAVVHQLHELFDQSITAKVLRVAQKQLDSNTPPTSYPHHVLQSGKGAGLYLSKPIDFWTCGFFPGSIYSLLERVNKYPESVRTGTKDAIDLPALRRRLEVLGRTWSDPIHAEARLTNTHDMGFIMLPHMRPRWEMYHDEAALATIITAANNLATRFDPVVGAIRSWDPEIWQLVTGGKGRKQNYIVIVDSLMNLDLLYYAAAQTGNRYLSEVATSHARVVLGTHLRPEPKLWRAGYTGMLYSSRHVINFDAATGDVAERLTAQGFSADSTWSRGQAWAITGFAQCYRWTRQPRFLDAACGLAEYFLLQLELAPPCVERLVSGEIVGRHVPVWDFQAPIENEDAPLRDTSAGVVAAYGMLLLSQILSTQGQAALGVRYFDSAIRIVQETLKMSLSKPLERLTIGEDGLYTGVGGREGCETFDAILRNATVAASPTLPIKVADCGLVYADYFLIEFGTQLLRMGA